MKLHRLAALAWFAAAPVLAAPVGFNLTFEKTWDYFTDVAGYYNGGTAGDGTSGPNAGVSFSNVYAISNDALGPYFANAPSPLGVVTPFVFLDGERAFMNVADSVGAALTFFYSSPTAIVGAIRAYSGVNGTGTLLGTIDLAANSSTDYDVWSQVTFAFNGFASSFEFTNASSIAAFDNISAVAVPEPETMVLLAMGGAAALCLRGRRRTGLA